MLCYTILDVASLFELLTLIKLFYFYSDLSTNRITSLHKDTFKDLSNLTEL